MEHFFDKPSFVQVVTYGADTVFSTPSQLCEAMEFTNPKEMTQSPRETCLCLDRTSQ